MLNDVRCPKIGRTFHLDQIIESWPDSFGIQEVRHQCQMPVTMNQFEMDPAISLGRFVDVAGFIYPALSLNNLQSGVSRVSSCKLAKNACLKSFWRKVNRVTTLVVSEFVTCQIR